MVTGIVKSFDVIYGSGFIAPDDGSKDVYITHSATEGDELRDLREGQRVSFEIAGGAAYRYAIRIQILSLADVLIPA
jgi:cold shock protein